MRSLLLYLLMLALIIIRGIRAEDSAQMRFTEHDHVVEAFSADRADESLNVSVLPK